MAQANDAAQAGDELPPGAGRGAAGFFRVAPDAAGRWWLVDPDGARVFLRCVHGMRPAETPADAALSPDTAARLRRWGFNAAGLDARGAGHEDGLPSLAAVDFCTGGPLLAGPGLRLPDVFDAGWGARAAERALTVCAPRAEERALVGWVTDDGLAWGQDGTNGRPTLLQLCLALEPSHGAYHAAWEFVLAPHRGRLDALARSWGVGLPNRETVRELVRAESGLATRGYLRDQARWTRELARRYFTTTAAAVRAADPHHLVLGCRCRGAAGPEVAAEAAYPAVDVGLQDWSTLPPGGGSAKHPVLADDVSWVHEAFFHAPAGKRPRRLTAVERMLQRARGALERLARHPAVVGYAWSQWQDEPGEQPPFGRGLVHTNGAEAREHTELLATFNFRCETLRRSASPVARSGPNPPS
jgi:agarase